MNFDRATYKQAARAYERKAIGVGRALHGLCEQYPDHSDPIGVYTKLTVIGRTYATGIERQMRSDSTQGDALNQLYELLWRNHRSIDRALAPLRSLREPLTAEQLPVILQAHADLLWFLDGVAQKTPRSFVSKYLHFHCPVVPIYDRFAAEALNEFHPSASLDRADFAIPAEADRQYARFVQRFWLLHQTARAAGVKPMVKLLDEYLLAVAAKQRKSEGRKS